MWNSSAYQAITPLREIREKLACMRSRECRPLDPARRAEVSPNLSPTLHLLTFAET